ncbi:response regulator transcription factor [Consotaella aegiceratis]|uniref:response regulator transcription factor n=1 Tax=Consotaella aegiceratis TaxID=3097961 RepID=UPI002F3FDE6C
MRQIKANWTGPGFEMARRQRLLGQTNRDIDMTTFEGPSRPVVLVIDDDGAVRRSLQFSLELEGFETCAFADAADFFRQPDVSPMACLVVDYILPGLDGLQLIEELRERGSHSPAILITSQPKPAVTAKAATLGVTIVEKPLLGNTLVEEIKRSLAGVAAKSATQLP